MTTVVIGKPSRDGRSCTVKCPFCGKKHVHGTPDGDAGLRLSHCWIRQPAGYRIVLAVAS